MALKAILARRKLDTLNARMDALRAAGEAFVTREAELEAALVEARTDEELTACSEAVEAFDAERTAHNDEVSALQAEIDAASEELRSIEEQQPSPALAPPNHNPAPQAAERKDDMNMNIRAFRSMTMEQRSAFVAREDVKNFLSEFRARFTGVQSRAVANAELAIPTVMLPLLREAIETSSKLLRYVNVQNVSGTARQNIMGTIPEAVWTEMCATLNELNFSLNQIEVDGFKVGGFVAICNALLKDNDIGLLEAIISGIGAAIAKALDKAILYGTGTKMPLGIATRLAQTSQPSDYSSKAPAWVDLHTSNVITISSSNATGIKLFQNLVSAFANAKGNYSASGAKFWAMNESTHSKLMVEAMSINASGAIVSGQTATMPVIGGDIVILGDDIITSNTIIAGYGDLYLLAEREGTVISSSEHARFIEDQTVVKGSARYDGKPAIANGFVAIGIGAAPTMSAVFAPDTANAPAAG